MQNPVYWLALQAIDGVGPVLFRRLLEIAGSPEAVFEQAPYLEDLSSLNPKILDQLSTPDLSRFDATLKWAEQPGNTLLTLSDPDYPSLLKEIEDAPPLLYVHGNMGLLNTPQLAIVGSRNPSITGQETAADFALNLSGRGITITSGLALGIDTAAHRGALSQGKTIAVMGTGINRIYPARNRQLAHEIIDNGGALVSEMPLDMPPLRENFPRRNRIISGMSLGTLVVEAARRSGSLITARMAAEQGREVFAVPGSVHNPLAKGCHYLIHQGAKLVETADDITDEIAPQLAQTRQNAKKTDDFPSNLPLDKEHQSVLTCVGFEPTAIDVVVSRSGLTAKQVSSMLLVLELQDYLQRHAGGFYSRKI